MGAGRRFREGFTLLEIIVVIAVIATLAAVVAPSVIGNIGEANSTAARQQIEIFGLALETYRLHNATYPTTEQGLGALRTLEEEWTERLGLTPREVEVAKLLANRRTNKEIARELNVAQKTARRHTANVLSKLGLNSRLDVERAIGSLPIP